MTEDVKVLLCFSFMYSLVILSALGLFIVSIVPIIIDIRSRYIRKRMFRK